MATERWSVIKLLKWTADYFAEKGIDSARLEAELLLAATLKLDRVGLYVNFERPLEAKELASFRQQVKRRAAHEPVQYILGETEFWSLPFKVSPAVLVPRADTEVLVEEALKRLAESDDPAQILDIGAGSGAIAIALAHEKPQLIVTALDCSEQALAVAAENAQNNGVAERIEFIKGDLAQLPQGPFEMIVSNPPYIPTEDWRELMPEVREHEPRLALDGGEDGLNAYRQISQQAGQCLKSGGWLLVEVGIDQAQQVANLFEEAGLVEISQRDDYSGIPRVVVARKQA